MSLHPSVCPSMGPQQQTCCLLLWVSGQEITLDCCIASTQQQQQYVEGCATFSAYMKLNTDTHTHTHLMALFPGLPV